jgi:hypothetical protein
MRKLLNQEMTVVSGGLNNIGSQLDLIIEQEYMGSVGCSFIGTELSNVQTNYPLIAFDKSYYAVDSILDLCRNTEGLCKVKYIIECETLADKHDAATRKLFNSLL